MQPIPNSILGKMYNRTSLRNAAASSSVCVSVSIVHVLFFCTSLSSGIDRRADRIVAFVRGRGSVVVVPRLTARDGAGWGATRLVLPRGRWLNLFGGDGAEPVSGQPRIARLFERFPVALLEAMEPGER